MDENTSFFSRLMDKIDGGFEVDAEIVVLMVFTGNVKRIGNMFFGVPNIDVFAGSQQGFYFKF